MNTRSASYCTAADRRAATPVAAQARNPWQFAGADSRRGGRCRSVKEVGRIRMSAFRHSQSFRTDPCLVDQCGDRETCLSIDRVHLARRPFRALYRRLSPCSRKLFWASILYVFEHRLVRNGRAESHRHRNARRPTGNIAIGRRADLQRSRREQPESVRERAFVTRYCLISARSTHSSGPEQTVANGGIRR